MGGGGGSDPGGRQAADEGDAAQTHLPEEGGAGGLHDEVLQEDAQLREQGAGGGGRTTYVTQIEECTIHKGDQTDRRIQCTEELKRTTKVETDKRQDERVNQQISG